MAGYGASELDGVLARSLAIMFLVYGTYNPGGYSYYHWVIHGGTAMIASKLCVGLVIVLGYIICINATIRSLGALLLVPGISLIGALIWMLSSWGWIDLSDRLQRILVGQAALVAVFSAGLPFSQIRYRLTGQKDSRTVGNPPLFG